MKQPTFAEVQEGVWQRLTPRNHRSLGRGQWLATAVASVVSLSLPLKGTRELHNCPMRLHRSAESLTGLPLNLEARLAA